MNNGVGLRVVLWLSGCSHHCYNCQNPQTWNPDSGIPFDESAKQEIFTELSKDYISGLTLSGGDPLHENNLDEVLSLIKEIRNLFPEKTIWLYTGYDIEFSTEELCNNIVGLISTTSHFYPICKQQELATNQIKRSQIIEMCDVVIDGKYIDEQKDLTLAWRGSKNQHVIDIKKSLVQGGKVLYCIK